MSNSSNFEKRARKYRKNSRVPKKLSLITEPMLDQCCRYALSDNDAIHKSGLSNLQQFLLNFTEEDFNKNQTMLYKYKFCMEVLKRKLDGALDKNYILDDINRTSMDITPIINNPSTISEMSTGEVKYFEQDTTSMMDCSSINVTMDGVYNEFDAYRNANARERIQMLPMIKQSIINLQNEFRKHEAGRIGSDTLFRLSEMEEDVPDIHKYVTSPSYKLVTGMQGLNDMLGGGFQKERVYSFFAASGGGKTTTLENIMYQLWKYNKGFKTKDKSKRPCIVLLTMENLVVETVCALYTIMTKGKQLKNCATPEDAIAEFRKCKFEFDKDDPNSIEIVIEYKPVNSVTTNYLYTITDRLEDEGYEVIAFLQDYIMRIKPVERTGDSYQDLGNIVNEFKTYAMLKKVPVITASQLNREAIKIIEESKGCNAKNTIDKLGRANIGESVKIDQNLDGIFFIVIETGPDNNNYLAIKNLKHRYDIATNVLSIYQPFYEGTKVVLVDDLTEMKPAYRTTLLRTQDELREKFNNVQIEKIEPNDRIKNINERIKPKQQQQQPPQMYSMNPEEMVEHDNPRSKEIVEIFGKGFEQGSKDDITPVAVYSPGTLDDDDEESSKKKDVIVIVDKDRIEELRSHYGIKKVL